jgi:OOP family OmpA-OmpF porin
MMMRWFPWVSLLVTALSSLPIGCSVSMQAGAGGDETPPPPPPPPPVPATTASAPTPDPQASDAGTGASTDSDAGTTPAPEAPKSTGKLQGSNIVIPGNIVFDTGKATLKEGPERAASEEVLKQLILFMQENPQFTKIRIEGHTDNTGEAEANLALSGGRALTIKRFLVDNGVSKDKLIAVGFGQTKPIANNAAEEGRAQNRRTEFKIAERNGKKYLGRDPTGGGKVFDL